MAGIRHSQIRGARGLLDWSMVDLARAARVSVATIKRLEDGNSVSSNTVSSITGALEAEGVNFLPDEGEGPGLRLRPLQASPVARFL